VVDADAAVGEHQLFESPHYAAAASLARRPAVASRLDVLRGTLLETCGEAIAYAGNCAPASAIKAQLSLSWGIAAALARGDLGPAIDIDAALADPLLRRLEALVELREDATMTPGGRRAARVTLDLGEERPSHAVETIAGDPGCPMAAAAIRAKFLRFATPLFGGRAEDVACGILDGVPRDSVSPFG